MKCKRVVHIQRTMRRIVYVVAGMLMVTADLGGGKYPTCSSAPRTTG